MLFWHSLLPSHSPSDTLQARLHSEGLDLFIHGQSSHSSIKAVGLKPEFSACIPAWLKPSSLGYAKIPTDLLPPTHENWFEILSLFIGWEN